MDCTLTLAMPQSSASGFAPTPFTWRVMTYVFIGAAAAIVQVRAGLEEESGAQYASHVDSLASSVQGCPRVTVRRVDGGGQGSADKGQRNTQEGRPLWAGLI